VKPLYVKFGDEEWLGKEPCEGGYGCQVFFTYNTILTLPKTRQMIINQALYKMESSKNP
jgi:hypothetical protein